jgi:hypothetical protein
MQPLIISQGVHCGVHRRDQIMGVRHRDGPISLTVGPHIGRVEPKPQIITVCTDQLSGDRARILHTIALTELRKYANPDFVCPPGAIVIMSSEKRVYGHFTRKQKLFAESEIPLLVSGFFLLSLHQ